MKEIFYFPVLIIIYLFGCQTDKPVLDNNIKKQISDSLSNVAISFLHSWEPPFNSDKALSLFTQSDDFNLVIDGFKTESYSEWAEGVPNYMADDNYFFKLYTHEIKDIKTVVLSPGSGVVTITYIWENISKDDVHKKVDGAITLTCRKEDNKWKIVHYHGSHGEERIID